MTTRLYPTSQGEIAGWCRRNVVRIDAGRKRFMQFVVLESIAASPLRNALCFKGGNALRFLHNSPRSTIDLDFTVLGVLPDDTTALKASLDPIVQRGALRFGVKARVQSARRQPSQPAATRPTHEVRVGYQFPGDRHYEGFDEFRKGVSTVVELEISFNDVVCEDELRALTPMDAVQIRACTLDDILAEKLRALLQQRIRNRSRRQDVYDIARANQKFGATLDYAKIGRYLIKKCAGRDLEPHQADFDESVRDRARVDYDTLFDAIDPDSIPFDQAWSEVLAVVRNLSIPE